MRASSLKHFKHEVPDWIQAMIPCSSEGIVMSVSVSFWSEFMSISFFVFSDKYLISSDVEIPERGSDWLKRTKEKPEGVFRFFQVQWPLTRSLDWAIEREMPVTPSFRRWTSRIFVFS